ncbi:hypothetical protein F5H01DRAFT_21863 [Linnemannia elongata]|nr:hypothetical protein F5H01DRAFT_21863 [Linnemannia elongata]
MRAASSFLAIPLRASTLDPSFLLWFFTLVDSKRLFLSTTSQRLLLFSCFFFVFWTCGHWSNKYVYVHVRYRAHHSRAPLLTLSLDKQKKKHSTSSPSYQGTDHSRWFFLQALSLHFFSPLHLYSAIPVFLSSSADKSPSVNYSHASVPHFLLAYNAFSLSVCSSSLFSLAYCEFRQVMLTLSCRGLK